MTSVLIVDGKEYIPATQAGKHFGYSKDYLLLLSKSGKIDGKKIGNKWYVFLPSAEAYFRTAQSEQEERRKLMSEERKAELRERAREQDRTPHRVALLETVAILILGLALGTTGYMGTTVQMTAVSQGDAQYGIFEHVARALYTSIQGMREGDSTVPQQESVAKSTTTEERESSIAEEAPSSEGEVEGVVVIPEEGFSTDRVASIQHMFSDPVSIEQDPKNPETGIITPQFRDTDNERYRFIFVPVTPQSQ